MHYSCPNCKRVYFESNPQGTCPECGVELVSSESGRLSTDAAAPAVTDRPDPMTLMGEDFLADTAKREQRPPLFGVAQTAAETRQPGRAAAGPSDVARRPAPRPLAAGRSSKKTVLAITTISFGALAAILFLVLLLGGSDVSSLEDAQAKVAGLEKRATDLEEGNAALKDENTRLSVEKEDLRLKVEAFKAQMERAARARRLTLGASRLLERRSRLERALRMAETALAAEAGSVDAMRLKGRVLAATGKTAGALDAFEAAHNMAGEAGDVEALVLAGELCLTRLGDRERALGLYRKASELKAVSAYRLIAEARTLFLRGDSDRALRKAMAARKADPALALAPLVIGEAVFEQALERSGAERRALLEKADPFLLEALSLDPNSAHACLLRGRLLIEQNSLIAPRQAFGLARFGRQDEAERLLSRAKGLSPRWPDVYLALGRLRLEKGALRNPGMARTFAQEAVKLTGRKDAEALATLAAAHAAYGSPAEAARAVEEALEVDPGNAELRSALARYRAETRATSPRGGDNVVDPTSPDRR